MRLFLDKHYFISVINKDDKYSCQVMELVHGNGMFPSDIDDDQEDVVSCIVDDFYRNRIITSSMENIFLFHKELLLQILKEVT